MRDNQKNNNEAVRERRPLPAKTPASLEKLARALRANLQRRKQAHKPDSDTQN